MVDSVRSFLLAGLLFGFLFAALPTTSVAQSGSSVAPPEPVLPVPTARQLEWQRDEMNMFIHFGINTFTDREWGTGEEDPDVFRPTQFTPHQWARVARETGFETMVLTAKHHDGFALWPSRYTDHSIEESSWRDGEADVVGAFVEAARDHGRKVGLYLSPWDRHEPSYGDEDAYNQFYLGQLHELLTQYGPLEEVWFDGAKGEDAEDMTYHFDAFWSMVRQHQPGAVLFSDEGPDVRWIGNEHGFADSTNWSTVDRSKIEIGGAGQGEYLNGGERGGPDWVPGECDTSLRPGWFWHPDEDPKTVDELLEIYFKSVGRNCVLLLNVPPAPSGRFAEEDVERLYEFRSALNAIFDADRTAGADVTASSLRGDDPHFGPGQVLDDDLSTYWAPDDSTGEASLTLTLDSSRTFDVVELQEPIQLGQRVAAYRLEVPSDDGWRTLHEGTTVGHKKLDRFSSPITAQQVRVVIEDARAVPLLAEVALYHDPRSE
jgi:alpha-L-fucosidase